MSLIKFETKKYIIRYDYEVDVFSISKKQCKIIRSEEIAKNIIVDFCKNGICGVEILDFSKFLDKIFR